MSKFFEYIKIIEKSGLFDRSWYIDQYTDVKALDIDPILHYLRIGARLQRDPSPHFRTAYYLKSNPDVAESAINPLIHYLEFGKLEGRLPVPFSTTAPAEDAPIVPVGKPAIGGGEAGMEAPSRGEMEIAFIDKSGMFQANWYLETYPDVVNAEADPLWHYVISGAAEGRNPNPWFDTKWYKARYADEVGGNNPFYHYIKWGRAAGFSPSRQHLEVSYLGESDQFDIDWYLAAYPDVADAQLDPVSHYVVQGAAEGRNPTPWFHTSWYKDHYAVPVGINPFYYFLTAGTEKGHYSCLDRLVIDTIRSSGLMDVDWYLDAYPDVASAGIDPIVHYVSAGAKEGRNPNSWFNTSWYRHHFADLQDMNPLYHYITAGQFDGKWRNRLAIVPYYIAPARDQEKVKFQSTARIAMHIHLFYEDMLSSFTSRLKSLDYPLDIFVSVSDRIHPSQVSAAIKHALPQVGRVYVETVPNRGRDIAPLIVQFGPRLLNYDIIGHFHTKKSPHNSDLEQWFTTILDLLIGPPENSGGRLSEIFKLLNGTAKIVYPQGPNLFIKDPSGWGDNFELSKYILESYSSIDIENFPNVEFSEGSMFWARAESLRDFLRLPLRFQDFPPEPIPADGTLAHALERLLFVLASTSKGEFYKLCHTDSVEDYQSYEGQQDFSSLIQHDDVKVLAYYLPQFHPIPENDAWHGKGFTEWTKVRAAKPLFADHYQQHIPHEDIGYYLLDGPEMLRKQANMMRKSGVHGQIFYHYWFSGKLILEKPAQCLLETPDIDMPFCFCWANENWTRRWDGNESDVLLGQDYSREDARAFIRYLIPFFRDPRYIRIEDRPVLFVYRPNALPEHGTYIEEWNKGCIAAGLPAPYVIATLTRGATDPRDYHMDAAVERVLHDWTAGAVADIKSSLPAYQQLRGSVLPYDEVASFYEKPERKDFTYFRSIVPNFDNTARYGSDALVLHNCTPRSFQTWLEKLIKETKENLPEDRRFVVVNAWNEWAEGAHLEPDSRHGYAYLNCVGRALSGIPYSGWTLSSAPLPKVKLHLVVPEHVTQLVAQDGETGRRFRECLIRSSVWQSVGVSTNDPELANILGAACLQERGEADFELQVRRMCLFDPRAIDVMLRMALQAPDSVVIPNTYDSGHQVIVPTENMSVPFSTAYSAPLVLIPRLPGGYRNVRMAGKAKCFPCIPDEEPVDEWPVVTTIIRIHRSGDFDLLKNALYCLAAMKGCRVVPLIMAQDLLPSQKNELKATLEEVPWAAGVIPEMQFYHSEGGKGDLRSTMLNEGLRAVTTRYAAFLDHDDLLFASAYEWLIHRLKATRKAVAFGRVFQTYYQSDKGVIVNRYRCYEYGYSYEEFVINNHAPLHSFILDLSKLDVSGVRYYDDQRYCEDYLMTLQLFTGENADWEGLAFNQYIGDYIHSLDRQHTLAFVDEGERQALTESDEYRLCEDRINLIRRSLGLDFDADGKPVLRRECSEAAKANRHGSP